MKKRVEFFGTKVPKGWCIAWDAFSNPIVASSCRSVRTDTASAFANSERKTIRAGMIRVVAGRTRDIAVARKYRVKEQQLTQINEFGIELQKI